MVKKDFIFDLTEHKPKKKIFIKIHSVNKSNKTQGNHGE